MNRRLILADNEPELPEERLEWGLRDALAAAGVPTVAANPRGSCSGFPFVLTLADGSEVVLDLAEPWLFDRGDPEALGIAFLDADGKPIKLWGLAKRVRALSQTRAARTSEWLQLLRASGEGEPGSAFADRFRLHTIPLRSESCQGTLVLVTNASEEKQAKDRGELLTRESATFRRLGRILTTNSPAKDLCVAALHELGSTWELGAVLLWTLDPAQEGLKLTASSGVNRQGTALIERLSLKASPTCLAELAAQSLTSAHFVGVQESLMAQDLEAKFCYLKPGGMSVFPLVVGGQLLGVLELIGREGDRLFEEAQSFFQTVAEHLALALYGANLFESFERLASHDPLTGISNHRSLQDFLRSRLSEAERSNQEIGVIMIDVDFFRSFNEEEGHDTGDSVLKQVAETIRDTVRPYDMAARYGGEEFAAVLCNAGKDTTLMIAERIRKRVSNISIQSKTGRARRVTVSLGCAVFPGSGQDGAGLLRSADEALFEAKRKGRDRVVFRETQSGGDEEGSWDESAFWRFLSKRQRKAAADRLTGLERQLIALSRTLGLSRTQWQVLRAATVVWDAFTEAREDSARLTAFEAADELRLVLPTLFGALERFDGAGPGKRKSDSIPLLGRVLSVLLALHGEGGASLYADEGRFDPEIVALVSDLELAA